MADKVSSRALGEISKAAAGLLIAAGFKRRGHHFVREKGGLFHALHWQPSRWNTAQEGEFTINLVVTSPKMFSAFLGLPFPSNPATAAFPIRDRIGFHLPLRKDHWWAITPGTDLEQLGREIGATLIEHALPFFDDYATTSMILERLRTDRGAPGLTPPQVPVMRAILAEEAGHIDEARHALRQAIAASESEGFTRHVRTVADRLGLAL